MNSTPFKFSSNSNHLTCLVFFKVFGLFSPHTHPLSYQLLAAICSKFRLIGCSTFGSGTAFVICCYSYLLLPIVLQCTMYNCFTMYNGLNYWSRSALEQLQMSGRWPSLDSIDIECFSLRRHIYPWSCSTLGVACVCGLVFVVCLLLLCICTATILYITMQSIAQQEGPQRIG